MASAFHLPPFASLTSASGNSPTLPDTFFSPLENLAETSPYHRHCPELSDTDWVRLGITRVLHAPCSGRAFLQTFRPHLACCPELSHFFESLKSARRLALVADVAKRQAAAMPALPDALPEALSGYDLHAGDGHWHAAAAHDAPIDERRWAVGHLYALDLRTRALRHLSLAEGKKEHDMGAIKRLGAECFRMSAAKGRKVLWAWDRAGIDFQLWHHWKHCHGIYFVSRTKENMRLDVIGQTTIDPSPFNHGVLADELVATSQGVMMRRVRYQPAPGQSRDGQPLEFITSDFTLAPGLIAWIYQRRWEVEKVFDQLKNKLEETKAWASRAEAKIAQAHFLCLTHNLLELLARRVADEHGIRDDAGTRRATARREQMQRDARSGNHAVSTLLTHALRPLQRSVKFIRWLRTHWLSPCSIIAALPHLRILYASP
jgi:hypothetical protein